MNQTPPISPIVKLKLKQLDNKTGSTSGRTSSYNVNLSSASSKLQSLLDIEHKKQADNSTDRGTDGNLDTAQGISNKLSSILSQLIKSEGGSSDTNSADGSSSCELELSAPELISTLNVTITFVQNQENALNLLKVNSEILKEQYLVEKEMLIREMEIMKIIHLKQKRDLLRRRNSTSPISVRNVHRPLPMAAAVRSSSAASKRNDDESDRTISDIEEEEEYTTTTANKSTNANTALMDKNRIKRNQVYDKLVDEISKNQKLFMHNKFGYYYNTLNEDTKNPKKRGRNSNVDNSSSASASGTSNKRKLVAAKR